MNFILRFFPLIYLFIGFIPYSQRVDKMSLQWLTICLLLFIHGLLLFKSKTKIQIFDNKFSINYLLFLFLCLLSFIDTLNIQESIIEFSRFLLLFLILVFSTNSFKEKGIGVELIFKILVVILSVEIFYVIMDFISIYEFSKYKEFGRNPLLRGTSANINIASFSIASKLSFVLYFLETKTKFFTRLILMLIALLAFFSISLTGSRGGLLSVYILIIIYFIYSVSGYIKNKKIQTLFNFGYLIVPFVANFFLTDFIFKSLSTSYRTSEIINRGSDSRLQYYKDAIKGILDHPFNGVGLGNWKLFSIHYNKENLVDFIVPYHAHNDFLQITAELGVLGGLLFIGLFILFYKRLFDLSKANIENFKFTVPILIYITIYVLDSLLNFPMSRPMMIIPFIIISAFIFKFKYNRLTS